MQIVKNNTILYGSLLLLQCFLWGVGNPIIKIMLRDITPFYALTVRYVVAFLIFIALFGRRFFREMRREYIIPGLVISFFTAVAISTSNLALMYTQSTIAGFLMGLAVIFTPPLARVFLGARMNPVLALPISLVVLGMYYLCGSAGAFTFGWGEFYAVFSSFAAAFMLVFSSKYLTNYLNPFVISVMQTGIMALYCFPFALIFESAPVFSEIPWIVWLETFYLAAACSCAAYIIQNTALGKVPSTYVALIFCSEPLLTAVASYFLLGETLTGKGILGAAMIMISIAIASLIPQELDDRWMPLRIGRIHTKKILRSINRNTKRR